MRGADDTQYADLSACAQTPVVLGDVIGTLWWLCAALPIDDAIKMEWLMMDSWGARAEKVAAFCWGLTEGTGHPEAFLIKIGRAAEAGHCHQQ